MRQQADALAARYGPWAVVTGASDGIGRAFARQLASMGMNLVLVARGAERLAALADELRARHGVACRAVPTDLSDLEATARMIESTRDLDVGLLVAAAGFGSGGPFLAADLRAETEMVDLNCTSVLLQCWHYGHRFSQRGSGGVVLMSSLLAFGGSPLAANYAATKAYVQSLAEGLRSEWAGQGVDVIACAPGPIATGFASRANLRMAQALEPDVVARQTLSALGRRGTVRPGWLSKVLGWSLATAPRAMRVNIMGRIMGGMTAHQARTQAR
jgi:short-subunit dehydrogenase